MKDYTEISDEEESFDSSNEESYEENEKEDQFKAIDEVVGTIEKRNTTKKLVKTITFNCDNIQQFLDKYSELSNKLLGPKIFVTFIDGSNYIIKFILYRLSNMEFYHGLNDKYMLGTDAEIAIMRLLQQFTLKGYTKAIVKMYHTHVCENMVIPYKNDCIQGHKSDDVLCSYQADIDIGRALPKCAFIIMEYCPCDMHTYISKYIDTRYNFALFKTLMFQVVHCLYVITKKYPSFRHNDLHLGNILMKYKPFKFNQYHKYVVNGKIYYVPFYGVYARICDFGFSSTNEIASQMVNDRSLMYYRHKNDMLLLLHQIYTSLHETKLLFFEDTITKFLKTIEPNKTYENLNTNYVREVEDKIYTYEEMLEHTFVQYKELPETGIVTKEYEPY